MNLVKYFGIQCFLLIGATLIRFGFSNYVNKYPYNYTKLAIATVVAFAILFPCLKLYIKLRGHLKPISLFTRIAISVLAFFISIFIAYNIFVLIEIITGEMWL